MRARLHFGGLFSDAGQDAEGFAELQRDQRGYPESLFHDAANPGAGNSNLYQWMMEHTGDLIHRAACGRDCGGGWRWGLGAVREKVYKLLRSAENPRDIEDVLDQARRNWRFEKSQKTKGRMAHVESEAEAVAGVIRAGKVYAAAYRDLVARHRPRLTVLQLQGGRAAEMLGEMRWSEYRDYLRAMQMAMTEARRLDGDDESDPHQRALYFQRRP